MARKQRKHGHVQGPDCRRLSDERLGPALTALLEAGKYRHCLEVAKEIRRRDLLGGHKELVERAYRLRALELAEKNLFQESAVIVENAINCGLRSSPLADIALHCALATGNPELARGTLRRIALAEEANAALLLDLALLALPAAPAPAPGPRSPPLDLGEPLNSEVLKIERAFALFEKGLYQEAGEELAGIGRKSPAARWRLLLRGLIAREKGNPLEALQCWERIDLGPCGTLARLLQKSLPQSGGATSAGGPAEDPGQTGTCIAWKPLGKDPREKLLEEIQACLEGDNQKKIVSAAKDAVSRWPGGLSPAERQRLFRAIQGSVISDSGARDQLVELLGCPPEDPLDLRSAALHFEKEDPGEAHALWMEYVREFRQVRGVPPAVQPLARAMVLERAGDLARLCGEIVTKSSCPCPVCRRRLRKYRDVVSPGAMECYRQSIQLGPESLPVRKKLVSVLEAGGERKAAEKVHLEILERWPDDVATTLRLGELALGRKAYRKAFRFFETARALEPLNHTVLNRLAQCLVSSASRHAVHRRFHLARRDIQAAEGILGESGCGERCLAWSAIEHAAGDEARGEALFQRALRANQWEPEALFRLYFHLKGLKASASTMQSVAERFHHSLEDLPLEVSTVEKAAHLLVDLLPGSASLKPGAACTQLLLKYLKKAASLPFPEAKRIEICHLFRSMDRPMLMKRYAEVGRQQFPAAYRFAVLEAHARLDDGESRLPADLIQCVRDARQAAREASDLESIGLIEAILSMVDHPGELFGDTQNLFEFLDDLIGGDDDDDDNEDDDNEDDDNDDEGGADECPY
ncbi:MAG TPA: hypothetical protein VMT52_01465 [Planctomycetota bacterium]|nr:hypothetical protein [Planctomycetota bacterium]